MSYKTIKKEPTNSTFLDTYAWILFLQGRYEEANTYIEQAIKNDSILVELCSSMPEIYIIRQESQKLH